MKNGKDQDQYSDKETAERLERGLRRSLTMSPKPHKPKKAQPQKKAKKSQSRA